MLTCSFQPDFFIIAINWLCFRACGYTVLQEKVWKSKIYHHGESFCDQIKAPWFETKSKYEIPRDSHPGFVILF